MADGWATSYAEPREENVQDDSGRVERKVTGKTYGVYVRRTIDGKTYKCVGKVDAREEVQAALEACRSQTLDEEVGHQLLRRIDRVLARGRSCPPTRAPRRR